MGAATGTHEYHRCEPPSYFSGQSGMHDAWPAVTRGVEGRTAGAAETGDQTPDQEPDTDSGGAGRTANEGLRAVER